MIAYDNASTAEQRHVYQMDYYHEVAWRDETTGASVCSATLTHLLEIPIDFAGTVRTDAIIVANPDLARADDASTSNVPVYEDMPIPQNWYELGTVVFESARGLNSEESDAVRRISARLFLRV
jgi:hypothetical protein